MPWATPPSICPRHCSGFMTKPASADCTDCRMRTVPVSGSTATRTACTLNASERWSPCSLPSAIEPSARAPLGRGGIATISAKPISRSPTRTPSRLERAGRAADAAGDRRARGRAGRGHAACSALPATVMPAEANAPVSYRTASVSEPRSSMRSASVARTVATIWVCTVVVPLPNSAVPTRRQYGPSGVRVTVVSRDVPERRHRRDHRDRHALADAPVPPGGASTPLPRREGRLGEVEALVEAVRAPDQVGLVSRRAS